MSFRSLIRFEWNVLLRSGTLFAQAFLRPWGADGSAPPSNDTQDEVDAYMDQNSQGAQINARMRSKQSKRRFKRARVAGDIGGAAAALVGCNQDTRGTYQTSNALQGGQFAHATQPSFVGSPSMEQPNQVTQPSLQQIEGMGQPLYPMRRVQPMQTVSHLQQAQPAQQGQSMQQLHQQLQSVQRMQQQVQALQQAIPMQGQFQQLHNAVSVPLVQQQQQPQQQPQQPQQQSSRSRSSSSRSRSRSSRSRSSRSSRRRRRRSSSSSSSRSRSSRRRSSSSRRRRWPRALPTSLLPRRRRRWRRGAVGAGAVSALQRSARGGR